MSSNDVLQKAKRIPYRQPRRAYRRWTRWKIGMLPICPAKRQNFAVPADSDIVNAIVLLPVWAAHGYLLTPMVVTVQERPVTFSAESSLRARWRPSGISKYDSPDAFRR